MFKIGDKVTMESPSGDLLTGTVKDIKWGMIYIDFQGQYSNGWFGVKQVEANNALQDTDRR